HRLLAGHADADCAAIGGRFLHHFAAIDAGSTFFSQSDGYDFAVLLDRFHPYLASPYFHAGNAQQAVGFIWHITETVDQFILQLDHFFCRLYAFDTFVHLNLLVAVADIRSEEHTSELQSRENLVCRLLLEKKKTNT